MPAQHTGRIRMGALMHIDWTIVVSSALGALVALLIAFGVGLAIAAVVAAPNAHERAQRERNRVHTLIRALSDASDWRTDAQRDAFFKTLDAELKRDPDLISTHDDETTLLHTAVTRLSAVRHNKFRTDADHQRVMDVVVGLLERGADPRAINSHGLTVTALAREAFNLPEDVRIDLLQRLEQGEQVALERALARTRADLMTACRPSNEDPTTQKASERPAPLRRRM